MLLNQLFRNKNHVFIDVDIFSCDVGLFWCSLDLLAVFCFGLGKGDTDRGIRNAM